MNKFLYFISWAAIAGANIIIVVLFYWFFRPYNPIRFNSLPHKVINKVVDRGDYLSYVVDYCKFSDDHPLVSRYFKDGIIYAIPEIVAVKNKKGCGVNVIQLYIPRGLAPGEYSVEIAYKYQVNPIRSILVYSDTEKFIVK